MTLGVLLWEQSHTIHRLLGHHQQLDAGHQTITADQCGSLVRDSQMSTMLSNQLSCARHHLAQGALCPAEACVPPWRSRYYQPYDHNTNFRLDGTLLSGLACP